MGRAGGWLNVVGEDFGDIHLGALDDESGIAGVEEPVPEPANADEESIAELDEEHDVDTGPEGPGDEAGDFPAEDFADGAGAAYGGEGAFVEVGERFALSGGLASADFAVQEFADVDAGLDRTLSDTGNGFPGASILVGGHVADNESVGMRGDAAIGLDHDASGAIELGSEFLAEWIGLHAGGPEDVLGRDA